MPKLEPKMIQKELDQGQLWPVYWLYGTEAMKTRELLKRIRKAALGDDSGASTLSMGEQVLEGNEVDAAEVLDAALSCTLGGGVRFLIIKDAHQIKGSEELAPLLGEKASRDKVQHVCVFLSKDLDGRKKFSKLLTEKAAVVPCEEVPEAEREAWIGYLAKRREVTLPAAQVAQLAALDPWTLDIVDQELEKFSLSAEGGDALLGEGAPSVRAESFIDSLFQRDLKKATAALSSFADRPDESLPLLGLLAWNVRHLALVKGPDGGRSAKLNPYVAQRFQAWSRHWTLPEVLSLQRSLSRLDFELKQTPLLPLGSWSELVSRFCA